MKRLRVSCGICKKIKFYSTNRGITKVSSVIACENCRHFFQKLKKNPFALDCISPIKGSCYKTCSFMKTRCKACWAMQVLDSCPHSNTVYLTLSGWLTEECRNQMRGMPMASKEVTDEMRGKVILEAYEGDEWVEVPSAETELEQLPINNEDDEDIADNEEERIQIRPTNAKDKPQPDGEVKVADDVPSLSMSELVLEGEDYIDVEEDEAMVDEPAPMETESGRNKVSDNLLLRSKASERIKRKRKKVEYFTKTTAGRKPKGGIYGPEGKIIRTGLDLCDCLQPDCLGCHFPCPKCRSPKCGNECRVNRKWYYERVEVEGTKMVWINRFVPKVN